MINHRIAYEAAVNYLIGKKYYKTFIVPKIKIAGKRRAMPYFILSFDIDEERDIREIPRLLMLLRKYKIRASFAAIGKTVEKHPSLFRQIVDEGHELINHTYSHPDNSETGSNQKFNRISKQERFEEIKKCHDTVKEVLGYEMVGFRIPHFGNQYINDIYPMLKRLGYRYSSSAVAVKTKTAGFPYKIEDVWEFPITCCQQHPFCIFDTSHAFRSRFARHSKHRYLESFEKLLDFNIKNGIFTNIYQDPQDIGKFDYEKMLMILGNNAKKLEIRTYKELAKEFENKH